MLAQQRKRRTALRAAIPATREIPDHLNSGQMRVITPPCPRPRTSLLLTAPTRTTPAFPTTTGITITQIRLRTRPLRGPPKQHPLENRKISPKILQLTRLLRVLRTQPGKLLAQLRRQPSHLPIHLQRSSQHLPQGRLSRPCWLILVQAVLVKILCRCVVRVLSRGFPVSQAS
jgi:hypothetical protein